MNTAAAFVLSVAVLLISYTGFSMAQCGVAGCPSGQSCQKVGGGYECTST